MVGALHIFHGLVIVTAGWSAGEVGDLVFHVHFLALQQNIDNLSQLEIPGAKPAQIAILVLGLGLHPEQITLRAGGELQHENAPVGSVFTGGLVWGEASI
jgi:hypothetical protein